MQPFKRSERVSELIKSKICQAMLEIGTPPEAGLITITGVKVTDDLSMATVYYSVLGDEQQKERTKQFFQGNIKKIWRFVADGLVMKKMPALRFTFDETSEQASKIFSILDKVSREYQEVAKKVPSMKHRKKTAGKKSARRHK